MRYQGYYVRGGSGPHLFAWLLFLILLVLLVALAVYLIVRWSSVRTPPPPPAGPPPRAADDALEILRLRYARGEIDREAFLQASQDLGGPAPPVWPSAGASP